MSLTPQDAADHLGTGEMAIPAGSFTFEKYAAGHPGLYSWWVDEEGREDLMTSLGEEIGGLIYAGQAGATSRRSMEPSTATLGTRIINNHLRGTAHGSTFRKSISALLLQPLGLSLDGPDHLIPIDNLKVSTWMREHLSLIAIPHDDRDALRDLEEEVLRILDPHLNLEGMPPTPVRRRLSELRKAITCPTVAAPVAARIEALSMEDDAERRDAGRIRFMVPTSGAEDWRRLLADPALHWVTGRSARTMAHAWEDSRGWPEEVSLALSKEPELAGLRPIYGFPEFKTPLPGGRRASQTDLLVIAVDRDRRATFAVEGKVDEPFGDLVAVWLGPEPSLGKRMRLMYLASLLSVSEDDLMEVRYQLVHRAASAKIEARRNGSEVSVMLVHSWAPNLEGFSDFTAFASLLGVDVGPGELAYSSQADLWLGWITGNSKYLTY